MWGVNYEEVYPYEYSNGAPRAAQIESLVRRNLRSLPEGIHADHIQSYERLGDLFLKGARICEFS